ncbi:hypothetical protein PV08_01780 [Exophiala spinifera]|uniref:Uncharacterized protein n=1 Tax=Exophiala spinifera TaxID=91928 RepID=A0A0D2BS01_9EURO|nr:uncharacterized protein PV08_01780 [Exophiala spinifera]KIW21200.1 hypothetical protein PV08_01780 [Exophiala spinifera]
MQAPIPLPRLLNGALQPSASRIPHLSLHIFRRQPRHHVHQQPPWHSQNPPTQRRYQSSAILGTTIFPLDTSVSQDDYNDTAANTFRYVTPKVSVPDVGSTSQSTVRQEVSMEELLEENNPERILLGLVTPSIGESFVLDADDAAFTKAICALDPDYFIVPFRDIHRYIKPTLEVGPRFRRVKSYEERISTFYHLLDTLVTMRKERGHKLSLDVYRHLLRCAALGGNGTMARNILRKVMPESNITPDVTCYNYFMEALNWNLAYGRHERYHLRVVPNHTDLRARPSRPKGFQGHSVASPTNRSDDQSLRLEVLRTFNELVRQGLKGDEATFCNLITAMGREGDISSVMSVLKSVWNIDLEALGRYDEEEVESPTFYEADSPLRPTERLLHTVVHTFSSNNQVNVASRLIDYISRNYNMSIPSSIWTQLLEWTTVLAVQLGGRRTRDGHAVGRVSQDGVQALWNAYHDEPYNVPVTIVDQILKLKCSMRGKHLDLSLQELRVCRRLLEDDRTTVSHLYDQMREKLTSDHENIFADGVASTDFLKLKREFLFASLKMDCHIQLIAVALRTMLKEKHWNFTSHLASFRKVTWPLQLVPDLVREWSDFLPNVIPYFTPTGHVMILGQQHRHNALVSANSTQTTHVGLMRTAFDTYSPAGLRRAVDHLQHSLGHKGMLDTETSDTEYGDQKYMDWVLQEERESRAERLNNRSWGTLNNPGPDWRVDEWSPWPSKPTTDGKA